jgi:hypothetical protein
MATAPARPLIRTDQFKSQLRGHSRLIGLPEIAFFELVNVVSAETARLILNDDATQTPRNLCACGLVAVLVNCPPNQIVVDHLGQMTVLPPVPTDVEIALLDALADRLPTPFQKSIPLGRKRALLAGADFYTAPAQESEAV